MVSSNVNAILLLVREQNEELEGCGVMSLCDIVINNNDTRCHIELRGLEIVLIPDNEADIQEGPLGLFLVGEFFHYYERGGVIELNNNPLRSGEEEVFGLSFDVRRGSRGSFSVLFQSIIFIKDDLEERTEINIRIDFGLNVANTCSREAIIENNLITTYPNPFNSSTKISFTNPIIGEVGISVFDMNGRMIQNFLPGRGASSVTWNAAGALPSGPYFIRLETSESSAMQKIVRMK